MTCRVPAFCLTILLALTVSAQQTSKATSFSLAEVDGIYPKLETLYVDLHRNPELSLHEEKTAVKMAEGLRALGFEVTTGVGGTGVVGVMRNGTGPTVMIRTELDALASRRKDWSSLREPCDYQRRFGRDRSHHARLRTRRSHDQLDRYRNAALHA